MDTKMETTIRILLIIRPFLLKTINGKNIRPVNNPIIKPPIWAKLSTYGINPKPKDIIIMANNLINSFQGFITIFQLCNKSNKKQANKPIK